MTSYSAGEATARYLLDASAFYREIEEIKRRYAELRQLGQQAGRQTVIPAAAAPAGLQDVTPRLRSQADEARRAQRETLALAQAEARLLAAQGNLSGAIQRINVGLATQTERTRQVIGAETQLARLEAQQRRPPPQPQPAGGGLTLGGLTGAAGALGIGLGIAEIGRGTVAAAQYTTALNQTESVLRQLSGSQERYSTLVRIAAENQKLFGGSLQENYAPLTGVLALSNQTGASLEQLNGVTQLLLAKAPGKSAGDAFFGLGEFLSGKGAEAALSLADQFNLNKASIAALAQEGVSAEDRLKGLTRLLAEQGVTSETLAARLTEQSQAYNRLGASGEQAYIRLGNAANAVGVPLANFVSGGLEGFTALVDRGKELAGIGGEILASASSYEQYAQIVQAQNAAMAQQWNLFGAQLPQLTQAQYAYAQALMATGVAAEEARRRARGEVAAGTLDNSPEMRQAQAQQRGIAAIGQIAQSSEPAVAGLSERLLALAAAGGQVGDGALALATSYAAWGVTTEQARATIEALEAQLARQRGEAEQGAAATERASASMDLAAAAADRQKQALADATKAAAEQANAGGDVEAQARAAGDALLAAGNAGAAAAALLANSSAEVDVATAAYVRLAAAQARTRESGREGGLVGGGETSGLTSAQQARLDAEAQARFNRALQDDLTRATGTTAERLALVNAEIAKAKPLSDERRRLLVEQAQLEQQLAEERERAGVRGAKAAETEAERAAKAARSEAEARLREQEQTQRQLERRAEDHYQRLRQIAEDAALDASRDEEDYQAERQRLLAEGQIKEAQLLAARYEKDRRRAAEDQARARARQTEDFATDVARTQQQNASDVARLDRRYVAGAATAVPATAVAAAAAQAQAAGQAQAVLAATAGQQPALTGGMTVRIEFAPVQLLLDGRVAAEVTFPHIERRLVEDLTVISASAPPATSIAGGGRP